ncbi:nitroreductase family protein [Desulfocurvus sp. DL9XJH121]
MEFLELAKAARTVRRYDTASPVGMDVLDRMVDAARHTPSAMNKQPLRYVLVNDPALCAKVFEGLAFAGYLKDWPGPDENERPTAYVVICHDGEPGPWSKVDLGIVAQTMMLEARDQGVGCCMVGAIKKDVVAGAVGLPDGLEIMLVLSLGKPAETVVVEDLPADGDFKYWRAEDGTHHVPKRGAAELVALRLGK